MGSDHTVAASATTQEVSNGGREMGPMEELVARLYFQEDSDEAPPGGGAGLGAGAASTPFAGLILSKSGLVLNQPQGTPTTPREPTGSTLEEDVPQFYDPITMDEFVRLLLSCLCIACVGEVASAMVLTRRADSGSVVKRWRT